MLLGTLLSALRSVPIWMWALIAALAWGGWQRHEAQQAAATLASQQATAAVQREAALQASIAETSRRLAAQERVTEDAQRSTVKARAAAAGAAGAAQRLRQQLAALRADAGAEHPAAAASSSTDRLADLLGHCADRYREVAAAADRAIIAGAACERSYDTLRPQP